MHKKSIIALSLLGSATPSFALTTADMQFESGSSASNYSYKGKASDVYSRAEQMPSDTLSNIYSLLPEGQTVNPQFISANKYSSIDIDDELQGADHATAKVTFLNEGAGYRNTLGYFVYDTNSPPTDKDLIDAHIVIFPNTSKAPDGEMSEGDTLDLNIELTAGQTLAFFIIPNGWGYSGSYNTIASLGYWNSPFYSNPDLNPESTSLNRRHNVAFLDTTNDFLVLAFEDIYRPNGDNDFNDLLFTVEVTPFTAIDGVNSDGTTDAKYEILVQNNDAEATTTSVYPSSNSYATLAFEDRWPLMGDYDFNDVVFKYRITETLNGQRELKSFSANYHLKAMGAGYHNGFALHLPGVDRSNLDSVSLTRNGAAVDYQVIQTSEDEAVLVIEPDLRDALTNLGVLDETCNFYRTQASCTGQADEALNYQLDVTFISPVAKNTIGDAPYDPFIFASENYYHGDFLPSPPGITWQTHLKSHSGTSMMNNGLFGSHDDNSYGSFYFLTDNQMPWALNLTTEWTHPLERVDISHAYTQFPSWVTSSGESDTNWYQNPQANKIFSAQ